MTLSDDPAFDLGSFLPYLLNQAAEASSRGFQARYRSRYGFTRTQWRVLAHLGGSGPLTARDICRMAQEEKTKVSRAVAGLEAMGFVTRAPSRTDRRAEILSLTDAGQQVYADLGQEGLAYQAALQDRLGPALAEDLDRLLRAVIAAGPPPEDEAD